VKALADLAEEILGGERLSGSADHLDEDLPVSPARIVNPAPLNPTFLTSAEPFLLVGRETAVSQLEALVQRGEKVILIRGAGGIGKTTLALQFLRERKIDLVLDLWMAKDTKDIVSVEGRIAEWLRGVFHEEPAREFAATLDQLRSKLRDGSQRIAVLIDNLEPALDGRGRFIAAHRRYVELLRLLSDPAAQSIALITSRERLLEPSVRVRDYPLLGVSEAAWREFLESRRIRVSPKVLAAVHRAYDGSPKAMQILAGAIENDFAGDADAYWLSRQSPPAEQELENLIAEQFDRLRQVNPLSYRLLCRLGCYRYQDVSLPLAGVVPLLWETSPDEAARHAKVLQERALLKFRGNLFWLHPITKAEALARLTQSGEWRQANLAAAAYWTASIDRINTVEDALHAFEAYHHYLAIGDSAGAGEVILRRREGAERDLSHGGEPLDAAFYRLGLLQNLLSAITGIIDQISPGYSVGKLYDVLGLAYRLLGRLREAFSCHLKIGEIAQSTGSLELQISSLILGGYCKTDLWELGAAIAYFEALEKVSADTAFHRYAIMAWAYLSYLQSSAEPQTDADVLLYARKVEDSLGRADLNAWRKAYATFLLGVAYKNLGHDEVARDMLKRTINTSLSSNHTQIHARALSYMGRLCAAEADFSNAVAYHKQAICLLERLAAQCDLAEAHFLAGLTWKEKGEAVECRKHFAQAERLFAAIGAAAQVTRVQRAVNG
jgi:tetratricopeptide (TPR) repeat protein